MPRLRPTQSSAGFLRLISAPASALRELYPAIRHSRLDYAVFTVRTDDGYDIRFFTGLRPEPLNCVHGASVGFNVYYLIAGTGKCGPEG